MEQNKLSFKELKNQLETLCGGHFKLILMAGGNLKIRRIWKDNYAGRPIKDSFSVIVTSKELTGLMIEDVRDIFWHAFQDFLRD